MFWNKACPKPLTVLRRLSTSKIHARHVLLALAFGLVWSSASAQAPAGSPEQLALASAAAPSSAVSPLVIGAGDLINVAVFDTPSLSFQDRVDEAGFLRTPVIGPVSVAGLTTEQASHLFEEKLRTNNIMLNPSVTVQDTEYATQGMVVLGQVRSPGTYTLLGPHNLYDALSAAGGVTETGGPSITITHRHDPEHPIVIAVNSPNFSDLQRTTRVYPGDTVFVSKAEVIYVIGDVGHPGAYYIQNGKPLTVLNILALAQGANGTAKETRASIIRPTPQGGATTIPINMKDIRNNKSPDIALNANDILVVPRSGLKVAMNTFLPGASLAILSAVTSAELVR